MQTNNIKTVNVEMTRKLTSCKTELRKNYSNSKQNILSKIRKKTIYIELKNIFALVFRISDQSAIKNIHIIIWFINIITSYKRTELKHPICKDININNLQF